MIIKLFKIITAVSLCLSFALLVAAMIIHAVIKGESSLAALFAIASAATAFLGFIFILLHGRSDNYENK